MSTLQYGDVTLNYLQTQDLTVEEELDPSGTDHKWNKYTLRVRGLLASVSGMGWNGASGGTSPAAQFGQIQHMLTVPRRRMVYKGPGDVTMFDQSGPDAANGPFPGPVRISQLTEGSILVDFTVVWRSAQCDNGGTRNDFASYRYTLTESYDENHKTVLSTTALLITRSDLRQSPDSLRGVITPPVPDWFTRTKAEYTLSEDGLQLRANFEDREFHRRPPSLAVKAEGQFIVTSNKPGALRTGQVDLRLVGPPNGNRQDLINQAVAVALAKLVSAGVAQSSAGYPLVWGMFGETMYENEVKVVLQANLTPAPAGWAVAAFGSTPGSESVRGIDPGTRRRLTPLLAAAFNDPCGQEQISTLSTGGGGSVATLSTRPTSTSSTLNVGSTSPPPQQISTLTTDPGGYDFYHVESVYELSEHRAQLPGTGTRKACAIVRMANPTMTLTVTWTAKRRGLPPTIPSYRSKDPNLKEMGFRMGLPNIDESADAQSPIHELSGVYYYAVVDPEQVSILSALPPFLNPQMRDAARKTAAFTSDRILFDFQGTEGPNPAVESRTTPNTPPTPTTVNGGLDVLFPPTSPPSSLNVPPPDGDVFSGSFFSPPPVVNP